MRTTGRRNTTRCSTEELPLEPVLNAKGEQLILQVEVDMQVVAFQPGV